MSKRTFVTGGVLAGSLVFTLYFAVPSLVSRAMYAVEAGAVEAGRAEAASNPLGSVQDLSVAFKHVARALKPSVVNIRSIKLVRSPSREFPFSDPFWEFFGDRLRPRDRRSPNESFKQSGLGTGVVVSEDGYIVTNHHVVADADEVRVKLFDDREYTARVVGTDPKTEVALIKIDEDGLRPATLGNSDEVEVGEWVLAMGNPFGLDQTLTAGIVSAKGRGNVGIIEGGYENFIQTDAAINPGNSGGPLCNLRGEVIGINTAIFSRSGGYMGIGFAIPVNMVKRIKDALLTDGRVVRGYLGVYIQDLDRRLARSFGHDGKGGALVGRVEAGTPADEAGLREGDIITRLDGTDVENTADLRNRIAARRPGTEVDLVIFREGREKKLSLKVGELPTRVASSTPDDSVRKLGMTVETLTAELARRSGLDEDLPGVVVTSVTPLSAADRAGIRRGDIVLKIQRQSVSDTASFRRELERHDLEDGVRLRIRRGSNSFYVLLSTAR
ncbi:MAG: DegQ family serine endoprotease [Planctomycetota bacterium]|nr:DegQ family serine endoprotease [Planctomycetota bacterium]